MNKNKNLSSFFYHIAELTYAGIGVQTVLSKETINILVLILSIFVTLISAWIGYLLVQEKENKNANKCFSLGSKRSYYGDFPYYFCSYL